VRRIGYGLGVALLFLAAAALVAQLFSLLANGAYRPVALGSIWYEVNANSLVGFQGVVERSVGPSVWTAAQWVLGLPAWLVLGVLGALLYFGCRRRGRGFD
jgi:hypothetical protein